MNTTFNLFQGFESEVVASTQLPFCQIQNPPNMSLAQIKQFNPPMGWFIPDEQAELAEFKASNDWQPTRIVFGEDSPNPREVDGFLANHIRIVILHSSNIDVQEKATKGWRYLGQAYKYGQLTNHGELAQSDRTTVSIQITDIYRLPIRVFSLTLLLVRLIFIFNFYLQPINPGRFLTWVWSFLSASLLSHWLAVFIINKGNAEAGLTNYDL